MITTLLKGDDKLWDENSFKFPPLFPPQNVMITFSHYLQQSRIGH